MVDEKKLLERLKQKQTDAIKTAIEIYTPYLSAVIYNMAGSRLLKEDAEEVMADVFVVLWKNAESIDFAKGTLRSYLAAVARNGTLKKLNEKFEYDSIEDREISDGGNIIDDKIMSQFVWQAVMELGEPDSEIFVRHYKYDEKLPEIAKVMGLNLSTVKTKLSRGKKKLRRILRCEGELQ